MKYQIFAGKIFTLLAIAPLAIIFLLVLTNRIIYFNSLERVEGKVISIGETLIKNPWRFTNQKVHKFPIIRYHINDRESHYHNRHEFLFYIYEVGDKVDLLYEKNDPKKIYVDSLFGFWFSVPKIIGFIFFGFFWAGFINIMHDLNLHRVASKFRRWWG